MQKHRWNMTKQELIESISNSAGLTKADAARALDAFLSEVQRTLCEGGEVLIPGFGKFSVTDRPARKGRKPSTGETIEIPASRSPTFKAGKSLKEAVNR